MKIKLFPKIAAFMLISVLILTVSGCADTGETLTPDSFIEKWKINTSSENNKVIIDLDAMYYNDDIYAVFAAVNADRLGLIDLLGFTCTSCNSFAAASAYNLECCLEEAGISGYPIYLGASVPRNGFVDLDEVKRVSGNSAWYGCYRQLDSFTDDISLVYSRGLSASGKEINTDFLSDLPAEDFICEKVHEFPGKVTIVTLSSLTTIASVAEKDPDAVKNAAGIIIMGGDFYSGLDGLEDYEINFWFNPEATNIVLSAPWKEITIVSSDSAATCKKGKDEYEQFKAQNFSAVSDALVKYLEPIYENNSTEEPAYCWDPVTIVYLLVPEICTEIKDQYVCVDERMGISYGMTRNWAEGTQPENIPKAGVIFECDRDKFWDFMTDIFSF